MDFRRCTFASGLAGGLLLVVMASPGRAQPAPATITCSDAAGRTVRAVPVASGMIAKAATDSDGRPVVEYDPRPVESISAQQRLFVYAHECAHHALGHDTGTAYTPLQEQEADCHGIETLMRRAGFTSNDVMLLQTGMRELPPSTARRLPWRARAYDFEGCLPDVVSRRQGAGRAEPTANDCLVHNDAANAIVSVSRDHLTIDGMYSAGNRCQRELTCIFTIELGTLPDADADAGSWHNFRMQQTFTEEHTLRERAPTTEFRVRGTVRGVPAGESIDFRVVPACR
jgi:hypothetical protein